MDYDWPPKIARLREVEDIFLRVERAKRAHEEEEQFRLLFERFVFDQGFPPARAEELATQTIEILKRHEYKGEGRE